MVLRAALQTTCDTLRASSDAKPNSNFSEIKPAARHTRSVRRQ